MPNLKIKVRIYDKITYMSLEQILLILYDDKEGLLSSPEVQMYIKDLIWRLQQLNKRID